MEGRRNEKEETAVKRTLASARPNCPGDRGSLTHTSTAHDARHGHCPDPLTAVPAVQPSSVTKATRPACNVQHVRLHTCMAVLARSIPYDSSSKYGSIMHAYLSRPALDLHSFPLIRQLANTNPGALARLPNLAIAMRQRKRPRIDQQ